MDTTMVDVSDDEEAEARRRKPRIICRIRNGPRSRRRQGMWNDQAKLSVSEPEYVGRQMGLASSTCLVAKKSVLQVEAIVGPPPPIKYLNVQVIDETSLDEMAEFSETKEFDGVGTEVSRHLAHQKNNSDPSPRMNQPCGNLGSFQRKELKECEDVLELLLQLT